MSTTILCQGCRLQKPTNPCLKGQQQYCGERQCQRARKNAWQRAKLAAVPDYRKRQRAALAQWRRERPLHRYQKEYRQNHPEYVRKNREQQRLRNRQHQLRNAPGAGKEKIVKMDAFSQHLVPSGLYLLAPCSLEAPARIVKMDAFLIALQVFQSDNALAGTAPA
jgi:hypothetical protein